MTSAFWYLQLNRFVESYAGRMQIENCKFLTFFGQMLIAKTQEKMAAQNFIIQKLCFLVLPPG